MKYIIYSVFTCLVAFILSGCSEVNWAEDYKVDGLDIEWIGVFVDECPEDSISIYVKDYQPGFALWLNISNNSETNIVVDLTDDGVRFMKNNKIQSQLISTRYWPKNNGHMDRSMETLKPGEKYFKNAIFLSLPPRSNKKCTKEDFKDYVSCDGILLIINPEATHLWLPDKTKIDFIVPDTIYIPKAEGFIFFNIGDGPTEPIRNRINSLIYFIDEDYRDSTMNKN